jgi:hypothetical protein
MKQLFQIAPEAILFARCSTNAELQYGRRRMYMTTNALNRWNEVIGDPACGNAAAASAQIMIPKPLDPPLRRVYDVFNGDADGICALHQLRLAYPSDALLITGVKRDIDLLQWIPCEGEIDATVLDVSLDANATALRRILDLGGRVTYFDHHSTQQPFRDPRLRLFWDDAPNVCTSMLVDRHLQGRYRQWAVVGAFGDNLAASGRALAAELRLTENHIHALEELGVMLNYNAYGEKVEDLHIAPDALYRAVHQFVDPLDFINTSPHYCLLVDGYRNDVARMAGLRPQWKLPSGAIYVLPNAPWAHRIAGVFANKLSSPLATRSFAVLTEKADGSYIVSVRSGQPATRGANGLCEQFAGGGGRKAAAGINSLPAGELDVFAKVFSEYFAVRGKANAGRETRAG